tara:strand:- start:8829 stop:9008 length:180 start_codon:yes stop_codon:yes gene_type:complete
MGEAKRRKEQGLPPRVIKQENKGDKANFLEKIKRNQILPIILAFVFVIFLIFDLIRYYK